MEYVALYRKYRPRTLDQIYGQKYIVDIVKNSILNNKFLHAYLFSGPRGTGKTTIAKLIAKIVNCSNLNGFDPCDECSSCKLFNSKNNPDILEIDAASNNGVDEIRAIRDSVVLMPSVSKYKVYIIDEVHMLSVSAFNALLKTLEEPPKHVMFILATTELDKVPETIVSRCQCYDFKRISNDEIVKCLSYICSSENLDVDEEVFGLIGSYCNGGMRDSIGLLDKLISYSDKVDKKLFYDVVGLVEEKVIYDVFVNISLGKVKDVFNSIENMVNSGKSIDLIVEQLLSLLRNLVISDDCDISKEVILSIVEGLSEVSYRLKDSANRLLCFEIGILKIINGLGNIENISREIIRDVSEKTNEVFVDKSENEIISNKNDVLNVKDVIEEKTDISKVASDKNEQMSARYNVDFDVVINNAFALADKNLKMDIVNKWSGFSDYIHNKEFSSLVSYFLDSTVQVVGEKDVIISADYESIVNNAVINITKLELLFNLVMGKSYNIAFVLTSEWEKLRKKYVSDMRSGKSYKYIEQNVEKDDIIERNDVDLPDVVLSAQNIFGDDIVEIR